jgi:hypothetical protein
MMTRYFWMTRLMTPTSFGMKFHVDTNNKIINIKNRSDVGEWVSLSMGCGQQQQQQHHQ